MKKALIFSLLIFTILFFIPCPANALENQNSQILTDADSSNSSQNASEQDVQTINENTQEMQNLYNYVSKLKNDNEIMSNIDVKKSIKSLMKNGTIGINSSDITKAIAQYIFKELINAVKLMVVIFGICIVCALLANLERSFGNKGIVSISEFVCYSIIIGLIAKNFYTCISLATKTMNQVSGFTGCLMSLIIILMAASGGITEVAVLDPVVIGAINLTIVIYIKIIVPLILIYFVLQFVKNISPDYKIEKLANLFKQLALWIQGITMTVFIGVITIKDVVSGSIDGVTAKTAKYAVDNFIPVVGGCLSDAISTVAGYSFLLKSAVSGVGLVIIVLIILFPIITLGIIALLYKFTGGLIEPVCGEKLAGIMDEIGNSVILLTSCVLSLSIMFFITICIFASAGKMVL